jgi:hypothetical protein
MVGAEGMRGADAVNGEFEVGFDQAFELRWYFAELAGRAVMFIVVGAAAFGLLGRGPFSHASQRSTGGTMIIDYEPIARHGTSTSITVHVQPDRDTPYPFRLLVNQQMIEPMGYQRTVPLPSQSILGDAGVWLSFEREARQHDVLIRFEVVPDAVGLVPMHLSDGTDQVDWSMLVVP